MTYKLSPHSLNVYAECPRCFWTIINEEESRPQGPFPSLPSGMDKVIKKYFDLHRTQNTLPPELSGIDAQLFNDKETLKQWRDDRKGLSWTDAKGNELRGSLDDALVTPDDKLIVLDFKTRGFPLKQHPHYYQLQLDIYNFILRKKGFSTENYALLLFFSPETMHENGTVSFKKELVKMPVKPRHAETTFKNAITLLDGKKPAPTATCTYCQWQP